MQETNKRFMILCLTVGLMASSVCALPSHGTDKRCGTFDQTVEETSPAASNEESCNSKGQAYHFCQAESLCIYLGGGDFFATECVNFLSSRTIDPELIKTCTEGLSEADNLFYYQGPFNEEGKCPSFIPSSNTYSFYYCTATANFLCIAEEYPSENSP